MIDQLKIMEKTIDQKSGGEPNKALFECKMVASRMIDEMEFHLMRIESGEIEDKEFFEWDECETSEEDLIDYFAESYESEDYDSADDWKKGY
jgi:hypothetical protein